MKLNVYFQAVFVCLCLVSSIGSAQEVWQLQKTGVKASLRGLCVVNDQVVWASGSAGTVLRTIDGGQKWEDLSVAEAGELDFRDIHAFDEKSAVILSAGQPARIYKTIDGGANWKQTFEHPRKESFFDAISFWDHQHGIAMSDPVDGRVLLIETRDGGASWKELPIASRPQTLRGEGGFAASGTNMILQGERCFIALGSGEERQQEDSSRIVMSDDRGKTWKAVEVPLKRDPGSGIFSLAFAADAKHGVLVGGNYVKPELDGSNFAVTVDGGKTWRRPSGNPPRGYRSSVAYIAKRDSKRLIAVGPTGTDISNDGGNNWKPASEQGFHAVQFTDDGKAGWASGADGRLGIWSASQDHEPKQ